MSRTIYPKDFSKKAILFGNIKSKNDKDGAASVLAAFLAEQEINLTADATSVAGAETHETNRLLFTKQSSNYTQLCRLKFKPVFQHIQGFAQFLKSFYASNFKALGYWGIMVTGSGKIVYPKNISDRITLFTNIQKQHNSFAAGTSPLLPYLTQNDIDITADATDAAAAQDYYNLFLSTQKNAENETQQRDLLMNPVNAHIHAIGDFLKKMFGSNSKAPGDWGFVVDSGRRKPKLRTSTLKPNGERACKAVIIGSTFTNSGAGDLYLHKNKTLTASPVTVSAGAQFVIPKGFSTLTIINPSTTLFAKYTVVVSY